MRGARSLLLLIAMLALAACARQQTGYYTIDPATGQTVAVMPPQTYGQQAYAQAPQTAQQQGDEQPAAPRGLFGAPQAYAPPPQQPYVQQPYVLQYRGPQAASPQYAAPQYPSPQYASPPAGVGGPYAAAPYAYASVAPVQPAYSLDSGDRLRIVVFGQDGISNTYTVDAGGNVNLPLIGVVPARGASTQQLAKMITEKLKQGYVREPHVTVDVETYRPFFILGEVTNPGQYPYVANMTAETAVAIAGGFAPRASKGQVEITRTVPGQQMHGKVPLNFRLLPGDTIVVGERWF